MDPVTEHLSDSTPTEYVVDGLLPERDYTIAVRGYYQLLGQASTIAVRLEGIAKANISFYRCITPLHVNCLN